MRTTTAALTVANDDALARSGSAAPELDDLLDESNLTGRQFLIYAGQRLHPGAVLYNSVYSIRWPSLEPRRFMAAWQALVDSCDALRTVFDEVNGTPQQRILSPFAAEVDCVDLAREPDREAALQEWIDARLRRPLILTQRVFDTALIRTGESEYHWFLHIHHIVVDAAAVQIVIRRVTELYADMRHASDPLPRFAERAAAACTQRRSEEYRAAKKYWQALLRERPISAHCYGVDASRTTVQERVVLRLDGATGAALTALAQSLATPAMSAHAATANLLNAAFAAYLSRVSSTERVSIGATFHNRRSELDKRTIGLFMEVFPLVLRVQPQDSLIALMQQVAACTTAALRHRQYSVGHSARAPAYSGLFNYMPLSKSPGSLEVRRIRPRHGSNPISLSVEARGETYDLAFEVNAAVAATSSARHLAEHLRTLLTAAVRNPHQALCDLPVLPPEEVKSLLAGCTGPIIAQEPAGGCHALFEARVRATPNATALACGGIELSYAELNRRANRLAHKLKDWGAKRGKRVAISLERSPEMVIAVLAVMKSGAAYVPLDPAYPRARLHTMLVDADPVVLVTTEQLFSALPPHAARPLFVGDEPASIGPADDENPAMTVGSADIAYVMYTSGSTGTPKGVLVTHGGVANHLAWRNSFFPVRPSDRCLQTASLSFDTSVWEIFEPLSAGACLVLTRPRFEYDSAYLVKLMMEQSITVACFVPSVLRTVIEEPEIARCRSLRRLTTGGERLSIALQRRVREQLPSAAFYNGYGPTEATIASVYWRCQEIPGQSAVPIGRPIANTQVYVLDQRRHLVPPGVLGEIYIGGAGVAAGYLNRAELTTERFVDDGYGAVAAAKLYRTGDLGWVRSDGVFEFAGRADDQVKIRGVRVELGDIEAALLQHPGIRAAAVVCGETAAGACLTAYFVSHGAAPISIGELRAFLHERIPPALIPNSFLSIAALPVMPNGKLDRRALPALNAAEEQSNYLAPRSDLETRLVKLWEEALQARPIGIRDDFFALGGHSLLAVQIAAAVEKTLGRPVSPGVLFEAPTIEMLASRLSAAPSANVLGPLIPLTRGQPGAPLFLVHHISGDITAYRDLARYLGAGRCIYGVRVPELDSGEKPLDRVDAMASRYISEIRALQPHGPYLLGGHSAGAHIAFEMAQQLHADGERVSLLAILEADARSRNWRRNVSDGLRVHAEALRSLPGRQRRVYLWRKFASWWAGLRSSQQALRPPGASTAQPKNPVWSAMERAVSEYRPKPYAGHITLFRATDRRVTGTYSRTLGWGGLAQGGIRVIDVPGSHSTVLRPGSEPPMAAMLRECLDELAAAEHVPSPRPTENLDVRVPVGISHPI